MVQRLNAESTAQNIASLKSWNVNLKMFQCKIETENSDDPNQVNKMITNLDNFKHIQRYYFTTAKKDTCRSNEFQ